MNIYIAGPMRGYPAFNHPYFMTVEAYLRRTSYGTEVYNPAARDVAKGFDAVKLKLTGTDEELIEHNFCVRTAMAENTEWICRHADAVWMLRGWEFSYGAKAERALAISLGLKVLGEAS